MRVTVKAWATDGGDFLLSACQEIESLAVVVAVVRLFMHLRDESAETIPSAAILRQKLRINFLPHPVTVC